MSSPSSQLLATHANCLPVGTRVADFEIIGLIGEGGFGIVYLARSLASNDIVALKTLRGELLRATLDHLSAAGRLDDWTGMPPVSGDLIR